MIKAFLKCNVFFMQEWESHVWSARTHTAPQTSDMAAGTESRGCWCNTSGWDSWFSGGASWGFCQSFLVYISSHPNKLGWRTVIIPLNPFVLNVLFSVVSVRDPRSEAYHSDVEGNGSQPPKSWSWNTGVTLKGFHFRASLSLNILYQFPTCFFPFNFLTFY